MSYAQENMTWFPKNPTLTQPLLTFPVLGFISLYQAIIIFGLGLPAMFAVLQASQEIHTAAITLAAFAVFAMVRPPVIGYEGRLLSIVTFYAGGRKTPRGTKRGKKAAAGADSGVLAVPSSSLARRRERHRPEAAPQRQRKPQKMEVHVSPGALMRISIVLKTRDGQIIPRKRVRVVLDGRPIRTDISSAAGEVDVILDYGDCHGTRKITIAEVDGDRTGDSIVEREIKFVRG